MKQLEILKQNDKESVGAEAGEYLNRLLLENIKRPVLLMLSGGSALNMLEFVGQTSLGEKLTVSMLDERFSQDPAINNFHQMQKHDFYNIALESDVSFFGTIPRAEDTMQTMAQRWEKNLRNWKTENPDGLIVATLGLGTDGHMAGIFPEADEQKFNELYNSNSWIIAHNVGEKNQYPDRVTATLTFLKLVDVAYAYVCGAEKKPAFEKLIKKQGKVHELPALAWYDIKKVTVFTDLVIT